jgi:hypothetical protein
MKKPAWGNKDILMKRWLVWIIIALFATPLAAQEDALNLPAALFVLSNEGQISRYGLGAEGVRTVTPEDSFIIDWAVKWNNNLPLCYAEFSHATLDRT